MRIIRFLDRGQKVRIGEVPPSVNIHTIEGEAVNCVAGDFSSGFKAAVDRVTVKQLLPPLQPPQIIGIGLNYRKHARETGVSFPEDPVMFLKATTALTAAGQPIRLPRIGPEEVDCEGELAVVIGRRIKNVTPGQAQRSIFGYTIANDVSARDWQLRRQKGQWARGKSFDTFCPVGPWIVTADEIEKASDLGITTRLNDTVMQDSTTADMIFPIPRLISHLSRSLTLLPGTLILTGTPEGVGFVRTPPRFMRPGDTVRIVIEKIGELWNPVIAEAGDL